MRRLIYFFSFFILLCGILLTTSCSREDVINPGTVNEKHYLGALHETAGMLSKIQYYKPKNFQKSVPSSVDLSNLMPNVGNQGFQNSCVGWSVAYLKTAQEVKEMGWDKNVYEFSPSWIYSQINGGVDQGAYISDALQLIVSKGCDFLSYFPYDMSNYLKQPDAASFARAANYKAYSYSQVGRSVSDFKNVLAGNNLIVIGINVFPDFDNISIVDPTYDVVSGTSRGGHAICIVGYDDSMRAFKFINSWGNSWGLNGYGWISYDLIGNSTVVKQAFVLNDSANTDPAFYLNIDINGPSRGNNKGTYTWTANITPGSSLSGPFIYQWEYSLDFTNWISLSYESSNLYTNSYTGKMPKDREMNIRVKVKSATGISNWTDFTTMNTDGTIIY
jgi:Cysteine protease